MSPSPVRVRSAVLSVLLIALATWVYYVIPVPSTLSRDSWAVMFFSGAGVLGILIITAIQRLLRGEDARIRGLVLLLTLTVLFFSWADLSVSKLPSQFAELQTKTDSLYFNVSTLATVGFGDVHPVGQLARSAVTLQIVFNLVFLGAAVSIISGFFRQRAQGRISGPAPAGGQHHGEAAGPQEG